MQDYLLSLLVQNKGSVFYFLIQLTPCALDQGYKEVNRSRRSKSALKSSGFLMRKRDFDLSVMK